MKLWKRLLPIYALDIENNALGKLIVSKSLQINVLLYNKVELELFGQQMIYILLNEYKKRCKQSPLSNVMFLLNFNFSALVKPKEKNKLVERFKIIILDISKLKKIFM